MRKWLQERGVGRPPGVSQEVKDLVKRVDKTLERAIVDFADLKLELMISAPVKPKKGGMTPDAKHR